jgi:hypothetical protein
VLLAGIAVAAFGDKGEILGSSFTVGSADIKFLNSITGGTTAGNLVDQLDGPSFSGISPNWEQDYFVKIYNNAQTPVQLATNAYYETINDPEDLRQIIYVEPWLWNDADNDGAVGVGELPATSLGRKTIVKWKTEGFDLGTLNAGEVQGLLLKFSTDDVSDTKQGASAIFDFEFDSPGIE